MMNINHLLLLIGLFLLSCNKDQLSEEEQLKEDIKIIEAYISENNLSAESTDSGLHYIIDQQGTGAKPNINSTVTIRYTGYFTNGSIFDKSNELGATFNLQGLIKGWQEGIPMFNEGGKGKLLIPSKLGYGSNQNGGIPPNSVLIFDIELMKVH